MTAGPGSALTSSIRRACMRPRQAGWTVLLTAISGAFACAGTKQSPTLADAAAGAGGGVTGGGGRDGAIDVASPFDILVSDGRVIGVDALGDAACATATQRAQQVPLDIYIMMDSSGSMDDFVGNSTVTTKWMAVRDAILTFLQDPQSAGLGVGLQYFPLFQRGVPDTCETDGECAGFGPCDILRTCSAGTSVTPCQTNADCRGGLGMCVRLGVCNVSVGYCAPGGTGA